jgi:hypothetical protein
MSKEVYFGLAVGLLAIAVGVLQGMYPVISPIIGWLIVAALGIAAFVLCAIGIRKEESERSEKQNREVGQTQERRVIEPQKGSLNNVTLQDRELIQSWALDMLFKHGHEDFKGLLADRASGIPLNELMSKNCSECESPRGQKSKD